ncbi:MAG: GspH/FimT family pseudopilin [Planctomycetaceae bacterium]|nr:GspH/FimT family pseudopilin [Planctomycetaceae bacterium]
MSRFGRDRRRRPGLTLVDLTISLFIIAIIAAVGTPRLIDSLDANRTRTAARRVAADLEFARQRAITTSSEQVVRFTTATSSYVLVGMSDPNRPARTYTVTLPDSPFSCTFTTTGLNSSGEIRFGIHGLPDRAASIIISSGSGQRTVAVELSTGKVSIL